MAENVEVMPISEHGILSFQEFHDPKIRDIAKKVELGKPSSLGKGLKLALFRARFVALHFFNIFRQ